ncbi:ornithine cyclodeaminase family protein [Pelagicoccus albus]|uniref:Ornithine cyclodeaminase family protein n=1 Tax=Pelagicoccus albus TaxID=415222 RepID=A0A7X1BBG8_9BACT|nr:ornithine cyclodeaminase family protein [Pelagicoccus albus]MBC2607978.1 ornithine cyclodeaminase family protein [Pelagicoccus albus]
MRTTRILSCEDIGEIVGSVGIDALLDRLIARLETAFKELDSQNAVIPPRTGIHYQNPDLGLLEWMPASIGKGLASLKVVGYHPTNPGKRNLPTILSSIGLFDTTTGHLKCLVDGTFATALRTGAMTAIASKYMVEPKNGIVLGIVGSGAQAVTQIHALSRVFDIDRVLACDIDRSAADSLQERIQFTGLKVEVVELEGLKPLLESSDILCTCTSADPGSGPLFNDFSNRPNLHINAVGSDFPNKIELPISLLKRSFVCPDFKLQAQAEGECQQLLEQEIDTELSALLNSADLQNKAKDRLSVFDSTGHAYADYVTASLFEQLAQELGLGQELQLESIPQDPRDPYSFLGKALSAERTLHELRN